MAFRTWAGHLPVGRPHPTRESLSGEPPHAPATMVDGLLIALALLNAYIILLFVLHQRGKLRGPRLELMGPFLMWRTEQGKHLIDRISKPRRLWRAFGDVGIAVTVVSGVGVFALLLLQLSLVFSRPDIIKAAAPSPEFFLVLPGINPLIPLWYGILGLAVALIVHEGAHGVLSRAHDIKVKSLGLLFIVVPIGAFVEPDDEELEKTGTRVKARVFSAGVMANVTCAILAAALFSGIAWAAVQPAHDGLAVSNVIPGTGAEAAGLQAGMVLTGIDGIAVRDLEEFNAALGAHAAGEVAVVSVWERGTHKVFEVTLKDKYEYYAASDPASNDEAFRGRGFLGVSSVPMEMLGRIRDVNAAPLDHGLAGLAFYISEPFPAFGGVGFSPLPSAFEGLFAVTGPLAAVPQPVFWMVTNSLYWVFWLNLMVGTFNALPLGFLDGGQTFKAYLRGALMRAYGVARERLVVERPLGNAKAVLVRGMDDATQAKLDRVEAIVRKTTLAISLGLVALILAPIIGPRLM